MNNVDRQWFGEPAITNQNGEPLVINALTQE
jgi:hypothetical protein